MKTWAPELNPPPRPELVALATEDWQRVPEDVRGVLTDNQEEIYRYIDQLEWMLDHYDKWRTGRSR